MIANLPNMGDNVDETLSRDTPLSKRASLWREKLISKPTPEQFDELIFPKTIDPYSYTPDKLKNTIVSVRDDIRMLGYNVFYTPAPDLAECLTKWAMSIQEPSEHVISFYTNFVKEDLLYLIAHGFNRQENCYSHVTKKINRLFSEFIVSAKKKNNQYILASPAILEISWLIACNPVSEEEDFMIFGPNDPQWFTVLSHPNFSIEKMFMILQDMLDEKQVNVVDRGYVDAIFKNPKWNEHTIEALYLESPDSVKPKIIPYLLEHPECPIFLLERFFDILGPDGKIRFAQTTKNPDRLVELSKEKDHVLLREVSLNPYTPEDVAVRVVLETS